MSKKSILNIGAGPGRIKPEILNKLDKYFLVNLDICYTEEESDSIGEVGIQHRQWNLMRNAFINKSTHYLKNGWEEFISHYRLHFDVVTMYRYLEHVSFTQVPYFLYMISTIVKSGGTVEGIVPDYRKLAQRILKEDPLHDKRFEADNILTTTELLNEPEDPHASIWTADRLKYFFELEGRFAVNKIHENYFFDGRNIYLKFVMNRVV